MSSPLQVKVNLGERSYPITIASGLLPQAGALLRERGLNQKDAFVVTASPIAVHYFETLQQSLNTEGFQRIVLHEIPNGEAGKNWDVFSGVCSALLQSFPDAGSTPLVILLGGGVIGDLGGFAAAVFRRGVPFVQIPTTLLAAVDSSVGGKVAVNFGGVKNIMGAFSQPSIVLCDLDTLRTLSPREVRSGSAEIIKYGAVCSRELFEDLEQGALEKLLSLDSETLVRIVAECVQLKADVVEQDEYDKKGIRNVLNFGHTIGHGLELSADYALTHGEAIAIGMVAAARLALSLEMVGEDFVSRLTRLIQRADLPISFPEVPGLFDRVMKAMQLDKKFRDGKNVFVLPTGVGAWKQCENVDWKLVEAATRSILSA